MNINFEEGFENCMTNIINQYENKGLPKYSTGFQDLDIKLGGFPKSQLTLLAGRHSMGKTSLALNIASNLAKSGQKVLFISCEMNNEILMQRLVSLETEIDINKLINGYMTKKDWDNFTEKLNGEDFNKVKNNLILETSFTDTYKKLAEIIDNFSAQNSDGIIIIDYFQQLNKNGLAQERYMELADLASAIKRLAVANNTHIILLSQISRKIEERANKRPQISDLSECDALSQHSDNIIFLHREEYWDTENYDEKGKAVLIIDKIKNSAPDEINLFFQSNIMKFKQPIKTEMF